MLMEAELILQSSFGQIFSCKGLITKNTDSLTCACILQSIGTNGSAGTKQSRHPLGVVLFLATMLLDDCNLVPTWSQPSTAAQHLDHIEA